MKTAFLFVGGGALLIAVISAFILQNRGYKFWDSLVKAFLASAGILGIVYSLLREYF